MSAPRYVNTISAQRKSRVQCEAKLEARAGFQALQPGPLIRGVVVDAGRNERLDTVYYDTSELELAKHDASLRYRKGEGWTLKLLHEIRGQALICGEHLVAGEAGVIPPEIHDLVQAMERRDQLVPVAHLRTRRQRFELLDAAQHRLGGMVDDKVSVLDGDQTAATFREIEIDWAGAAPEDVLGSLVGVLVERSRVSRHRS